MPKTKVTAPVLLHVPHPVTERGALGAIAGHLFERAETYASPTQRLVLETIADELMDFAGTVDDQGVRYVGK